MSSTRDAEFKNVRLFDVRTVERNIKKGLVTRKDYDKYLKSLGDAAEKAAAQDSSRDDDDLDDDLDDDDLDDAEGEAPAGNPSDGAPSA